MSKIAIIGAGGRTGLEIVRQSLDAGYEVVALVRRPEAVEIKHPQLEIRRADVFDRDSLENALPTDAEAVVSAIGESRIMKPTTLYSESAVNLIAAMQKKNLRRLICIASSGYVDEPANPFWMRFLQKTIVKRIFHYIYEDTMKMEEIVRQSDLQWTLVRPPRLTDGRRTEIYRTRKEVVIGGAKISRSDLADYIVKNLTNPLTYRAIIGVSY